MTWGLFGGDRGKELLQNPDRQATVIVAKDGSGDTDDIQEGISMLSDDGGIVQVKEGTYNITSAILMATNNITLEGIGEAAIINTTENITMVYVTGENCIIKDLKITANNTGATQTGIYADLGADHLVIDRCHIRQMYAGCIVIIDAYYTRILDCRIYNSSAGAGIYSENDRTLIRGCNISNHGTDGITFDGNDGGLACVAALNVVNTNTRDGIRIDDDEDQCIILGNHCKLNTGYGVNITQNDCINNIVSSNFLAGNTTGSFNDAGTGTTDIGNEV